MTIGEFLEIEGYSRRICVGGISYLIQKWRDRCSRMPYKPAYLFEEWVNDLNCRHAIQRILENFGLSEIDKSELKIIDEMFLQKTQPTKDCVVTKDNGEPMDAERNWYYFRVQPGSLEYWGIKKS
jgi:hypothetical protein